MSRQPLDISKLGQFQPKQSTEPGAGNAAKGKQAKGKKTATSDPVQSARAGETSPSSAMPVSAGFPSREPVDEAQLNIKLPHAEAARFRRLAKTDRYTLGAFLALLMDGYEGQG